MKKRKDGNIIINLSNCKYDILREIAHLRSFSVSEESLSNWNLFWTDTGVSLERVLEMKSYQRINHFPGMHEICRKDHLARKVSKLSRIFPKDYNFIPKSWILPKDLQDFRHSFKPKKNQCFISKPDHGCQGKGIFLFKEPDELKDDNESPMVVQTYITNPLLIDGFKFDLRVYVLVTSVNPLRIFVYKDGLARFATEKYQPPSHSNLNRSCMHLTNYAINKNSAGFVHDHEKGSKRSIQSVLSELESKLKIDKDKCWAKIESAIVKTIIIVQPALSKLVKPWFPNNLKSSFNNNGSQCFEILGFDILLDSKMKPWVLEVNHSPSFSCDSQLDKDIKQGVIGDAFQLLNIQPSMQKKYIKEQKAKSLTRLLNEKVKPDTASSTSSQSFIEKCVAMSSEITLVDDMMNDDLESSKTLPTNYSDAIAKYHQLYDQQILQKLTAYEDKRSGGYSRVFPPTDEGKLGKYLYLMQATEKWSTETTTTKARKAFQEKKVLQQEKESRLINSWKLKQQKVNAHVTSKVSTLCDDNADFKKHLQSVNLASTVKRAVAARKVKAEKSFNTISNAAIQSIPKQAMSVKVQYINDNFDVAESHSRMTCFQPIEIVPSKYQELMQHNPLIMAKKKELSKVTSKSHYGNKFYG